MERCRLCYGRVVNGRCVDCGLDNSKSDKNYRLNTHNPKGVRMHGGDCDTHVNKETPGGAKKQMTGSAAGRTTTKTQANGRGSAAARTYETPRTIPTGGARARQLKKRQATGTVQRRRGKKWIVILLVVAVYAIPSVIEIAEDHMDEIRETVSSWGDGSLGDLVSEIFGDEQPAQTWEDAAIAEPSDALSDEEKVLPEKIVWDTEDPLYYEEELQAGFYTAGYDFPAGTYQMTCTSGDALLEWYAADRENGENGYALLLSDAWKEELEVEEDEMYTAYGAHTEVLSFEKDAVIYVWDDGDVRLEGMKDGEEPLKTRRRQSDLPKSVIVPTDGLESGTDFPEGVYDLCYQGSGFASVEVKYEDGNIFYMELAENNPVVQRIPLEQSGIAVSVTEYDMNEGDLVLRPSW